MRNRLVVEARGVETDAQLAVAAAAVDPAEVRTAGVDWAPTVTVAVTSAIATTRNPRFMTFPCLLWTQPRFKFVSPNENCAS